MNDPTVFYLIRHAEPDFGSEGRICLGRKLDIPLSKEGMEQAAQLADQLKERSLDAIYISPLVRAKQTADALHQACPRIIAPELTEVYSGEWDGMRFSEIYARYPEYFDLSDTEGEKTPPGGESDEDALTRGMSLLDRLAADQGKQYALVTHSGLGRIILCHLLGMPLQRKRAIPMKYTSCTKIIFQDDVWHVELTEGLIE